MLHRHLRFHRQARKAKLRFEDGDKAHRPGYQGLRGVSTPLPHRLRVDQSVIQGTFLLFMYGREFYLIMVHLIH